MRKEEPEDISAQEMSALLEIVKWLRVAESRLLPHASALQGKPYAALLGLSAYTESAFRTEGRFDEQITSDAGQVLATALAIVTLPDWLEWEPDPQWPHSRQAMRDAFFEANEGLVGDILQRSQEKMQDALNGASR